MKTKPIVITSIVLPVLAAFLFLLARYDLHVFGEKSSLEELTQEEKIEDFNYLLQLAKEAYPFTETIAQEKKLPDFNLMEQAYLEKIKNTTNNRQFVKVIGEMVQHLEHGTAHCDILAPSQMSEWEMTQQAVIYNVSKKSFQLRKYWWELLEKNTAYSHADLYTEYRSGNYVVTDTVEINNTLILPGSVIKEIDDLPIDDYVKTLFNKIWLRFDAENQKVYCHHSPFLAVQDTLKEKWKTEIELPDGSFVSIDLPVKEGYKPPGNISYPKANVTCINLPNRTAYIKIGAFALGQQRELDIVKIDSFFTAGHEPYDKILIDLRNNLGGAPAYWQKAFVERLIHEPVLHEQYTVVKKKVFDDLNCNRKMFAYKYKREIEFGELTRVDFSDWENNVFPSYLDENDYYCLRSSKKYEPNNPYNFDGEIFLLIDHDSFSATEDFVRFAKETGFAKIAGARSIGGTAVLFAPWFFDLPNSHIMLSMEIDMAFNTDGTINEIYGTKPDFVLGPAGYPTEMPAEYTKEALMQDEWVKFVVNK